MESNFSLRDLVRQILDETNLTNPTDIANAVADRTPDEEVMSAYKIALTQYVRVINNDGRRENIIINPRLAQKFNPSAKVVAIRTAHQRALHDRVFMGSDSKLLGDCGYDDLVKAAKFRRELADRNLIIAQRYQYLAQLLLNFGVATVSQLPPEAFEWNGND